MTKKLYDRLTDVLSLTYYLSTELLFEVEQETMLLHDTFIDDCMKKLIASITDIEAYMGDEDISKELRDFCKSECNEIIETFLAYLSILDIEED